MSKGPEDTKGADPSKGSLTRDVGTLIVVAGCLVGLGYFLANGGNFATGVPEPSQIVNVKLTTDRLRELCGLPAKDGRPVPISMLYSDDKRSWIEDAANLFARRCPNIQVKLTAMGDIESADAILDGGVQPTLWAPADDLVVRYLDARWKQRSSEALLHADEQTSLVRSPLVMLVWDDRLQVLEATERAEHGDEGAWMHALCALVPRDPDIAKVALTDMVPGRWIDWYGPLVSSPKKKPALAVKKPVETKPAYEAPFPTLQEIQRWGQVKFVHTPPTRSASGLEALYLMAYDYALPPKERTAPVGRDSPAATSSPTPEEGRITGSEHLRGAFEQNLAERKDALRRWLRRCEGGLEGAPSSAWLLTERMFNVGPSRYDGIVTYEHLTLPIMDRIGDHSKVMSRVHIIYPQPTIVNQHPVVFLRPEDPARKENHAAARKWIGFLLSQEMQHRAIEYGFRPANLEVSIRAYDVPGNPFLHLRRYGILLQPVLLEPPKLDGKAIHELIEIWGDATGRN